MKRRIPAMSLFLVLGTLIMSACAVTPGQRINPVEQASLRDTVKIEVMEFDPDRAEGTSPYVQLLTITDTQILDQLLDVLDTNIEVTLKVECIPEYELHSISKMTRYRSLATVVMGRPLSVGHRASGRARTITRWRGLIGYSKSS
jgi:hypothetical protein